MGQLVWRCGCGFQILIGDRRIGYNVVDKSRVDRIVDRLRKGHVLDAADKTLFAHTVDGSGRFNEGGLRCGM